MGQTGSLEFGNVVTINGVLFIPLSLIILLKKGRDITRNEMIVRSFCSKHNYNGFNLQTW